MTAVGNTWGMTTSHTSRPQLLKLAEVQEMTGLAVSTIYQAMAEGRFPKPLKVGARGVRWRLDEVLAWIDSRPRGGSARPA